jgi:membrane associated rhomboid family serine protease
MEQYLIQTPVASVIFVFTVITSIYAFNDQTIYGKFMLHPHSIYRGKSLFTIITSGMIHKDWAHLIFNMISYFFFAFQLEMIIGHWQFALLYIVSLALSDLPTIIKHKNDYWYHSLGASGAVCAVVFSYILFQPMSKMIIFPLPIPIPALIYGVLFLVYSAYSARQSKGSINHDAHFYGALTGLMITIILYPAVVPHFFKELGLR